MIQLQAMWVEDRMGLPKACNVLMPADIPLQCDHAVIKLFVHAAQPVPMQCDAHAAGARAHRRVRHNTCRIWILVQSTHILHEIGGMLLATDFAHVWHPEDADNLALQHSQAEVLAVLAGTQRLHDDGITFQYNMMNE